MVPGADRRIVIANGSLYTVRVMLKVACQNVFWFQGRPFPSAEPGPPTPGVFAGLVRYYRRLDPDVLCLQEVQTEAVFRDLAEEVGLDGCYCPGGGLPQYGGVVLWRRGRPVLDSRSAAEPPERMWQVAEVPTAEGPLTVANVHLPSNRHLGEAESAHRRLAEMAEVLDRGEPDIVAGDFNEQPGGPITRFLGERGYSDVAAITGRLELATTPKGRRNDQLWVQGAVAGRIVAYDVAARSEMRADVPGKDYLSDHFPLHAVLRMECK